MRLELTCGLLPLFKQLTTKFEVFDLQAKCMDREDLEGYRILECVKQTKSLHYVEAFMRHCGIHQAEAERWVRLLPNSLFSKVESCGK